MFRSCTGTLYRGAISARVPESRKLQAYSYRWHRIKALRLLALGLVRIVAFHPASSLRPRCGGIVTNVRELLTICSPKRCVYISLSDFPQAYLVSLMQLVFEPPAALGIAGNLSSLIVPFPVLCPL